MPIGDINTKPSLRELRLFAGLWFPAFFVIVGLLVWRGSGSWTAAAWVWAPALVASIVGWCVPGLARVVFVGWMLAAYPIGWIVSRLLLSAIYYCVFTPVGLMIRPWRGDPLERRFDRSAKTYWIPRRGSHDSAKYFRQF